MKMALSIVMMMYASIACSSDLIVEWSIDLRNPDMHVSPPLSLMCVKTKTNYFIYGTPVAAENDAVHRYRVPEEVVGRCILKLVGGMEPNWPDGRHQIDIADPKGVLRTQMPGTSVRFVFKLAGDFKETKRLQLRLFRISNEGIPLPEWGYAIDFQALPGKHPSIRKFIIPFADAGPYLAYLVEETEDDSGKYLYVKQFDVKQEDLLRHDRRVTMDDMLRDPHHVLVEFGANDVFFGTSAASFVNKGAMRHVTVDQNGAILEER